ARAARTGKAMREETLSGVATVDDPGHCQLHPESRAIMAGDDSSGRALHTPFPVRTQRGQIPDLPRLSSYLTPISLCVWMLTLQPSRSDAPMHSSVALRLSLIG